VLVEGGAVVDQQDLVEVVDVDDPEDMEATEALPAAQPKIPEIDEHRFRLRGVRARQLAGRQTKQPSTELCGGNIQTGRILGSMMTTYECQCHGRLANYPLKTWLYRLKWTFSEFARCALADAKAEKFSST
jgi:hypothetical protein